MSSLYPERVPEGNHHPVCVTMHQDAHRRSTSWSCCCPEIELACEWQKKELENVMTSCSNERIGQMTNPVKAVARKIVAGFLNSCRSYPLITKYGCQCSQENIMKTRDLKVNPCIEKDITDALTTFAAQQVQATWEEAAQFIRDHNWGNCDRHGKFLLAEFRRRAQEVKG